MSAKVFHIPLISVTPTMTLYAIVQRSPNPSNDASKDHPSAKIYHDTDALLADPAVDLVVVTTTPDSHFELCSAALQAGKHVLVEKPFVPSSAAADSLAALARQHDRLICVYQNRRWDSDFLTFQQLQTQGTLGRIVEFETRFDRHKPARPETWKGTLSMEQGGGVLYDLGTHLIDQAVLAFDMPRKVMAVFVNQRQDGAEEPDAITALLLYDGGLLVTVKAGVVSIDVERLRFWVRGTKGSWRKGGFDSQEDQLKVGLKPGDEGFGVETEGREGTLITLEGDKVVKKLTRNTTPETYRMLYSRFAEAVEKGDEELVPVKANEARDVLKVIEAARESARTGNTVEL
jgi:predicted dehydrogenase